MSRSKASTSFKGPGRIDVHHHCFPKQVSELRSEFQDNNFDIPFVNFPTEPQEHLDYMDEVGIQTAVIAPSIKQEWHTKFSATEYLDLCNESLKAQLEYVAFNPLRFGFFAILPLPHIEETLHFIREAMKLPIRPDGFAVATAMGKTYLGDAKFEPVWAELDESSSVIFVHPADTVMPPNLPFGPFVQEFAFDTCRAITSVINSGLLQRRKQIKFLFSHNGGAFPFLADRIGAAHMNDLIAEANDGMDLRKVLSTRNIYLDTSISSSMQYPVLKDLGIPTEHLLYATDYPYTKRTDNSTYLVGHDAPKASGLFNEEDMENILYKNSLKVFPRIAEEFAKVGKCRI